MRQFITSNLVASEMMIPNMFTKEQVFAMCEELQQLSFYSKAISNVEENYKDSIEVDNESYNEKLFLSIKELLVKIGEDSLKDHVITQIYYNTLKLKESPKDTIHALNTIYPVMKNWKSRNITVLISYYEIILNKFQSLEHVLPKYLYHDIIKKGLSKIIDDMRYTEKDIVNKKDFPTEHILLLYPEGVVSVDYYQRLQNIKAKNPVFEFLALINPARYRAPRINDYTDATLSKELLVRKFIKEEKYIYKDGNISLPNDSNEDTSIDTENSIYEDFYAYCASEANEYKISKNTKKLLDQMRKEIANTTLNAKQTFKIELNNHRYKKDYILAKLILHEHSRLIIGKNKSNIFHLLEYPSYENSISGLIANNTQNCKLIFHFKNALLKSSLQNSNIHNTIIKIDELIPLPYLNYIKSIERIKNIFKFDGLTFKSSQDMNDILFSLLDEKRHAIHSMIMEFYNKYTYTNTNENIGPLESIYFKLTKHEYEGIIRDTILIYNNIAKCITKLPIKSVKYLLDKQQEIDDGNYSIENFDFKKDLRKRANDIAMVIGAKDIDKRSQEIYRYADRYYDIWSTLLELYPKKKWEQANDSYADFSTMVALVQVEELLRKGKMKFEYKYSYKGDKGKFVSFSNHKSNYLCMMVSRYMLMELVSWQIICNLGFYNSVKKSFHLIKMISRRYKKLYQEQNLSYFVGEADSSYDDDILFTNADIDRITNVLREYCADIYNKNHSTR